MEYTLFAYQTSSDEDQLLHFTRSLEDCRDAAKAHQQDLRGNDDYRDHIGVKAIYECRMQMPDIEIMIDVLNSIADGQAFFRACVVERHLVELVVE